MHNDLQQVIEPLASYLFASEQPRAALKMALAVLVAEMEQTNRLAQTRLASFSRTSVSPPA